MSDQVERWHRAGHGATLRNFVFGTSDGLVTVLAFVAGVSASLAEQRLVLLAGISEMFAGALSMGLGAFLGTRAERDLYTAERAREEQEVRDMPHLERAEIRDIYRKKGFEGADLERVVDTITSSKERWIEIMMQEELGLAPVHSSPSMSGLVVGLSYIAAAAIPLAPYVFMARALWLSIALTSLALVGVGVAKSWFTRRSLVRGALETVIMGLSGTLICYGIGQLGAHFLGRTP
jgi:VIT1/CCC1 family predicted Fe2+/Mn2+ transporter